MTVNYDGDTQLLGSASRTTTQTSADLPNNFGPGALLTIVLDMTVVGTGSVTVSVQGKDVTSGKYYTLLTGAAVTTNSTNRYTVGNGLPATTNVSANDVIPPTYRILVTANNANAATYSVGYSIGR